MEQIKHESNEEFYNKEIIIENKNLFLLYSDIKKLRELLSDMFLTDFQVIIQKDKVIFKDL